MQISRDCINLKLDACMTFHVNFHVSPSSYPSSETEKAEYWTEKGKPWDANEQTTNEQTGDGNCLHGDHGSGIGTNSRSRST